MQLTPAVTVAAESTSKIWPESQISASECVTFERDGRVAQLVEQCPFKAWVAGSNPAALTILFNDLEIGTFGIWVQLGPHRFQGSTCLVDAAAESLRPISPELPASSSKLLPAGWSL